MKNSLHAILIGTAIFFVASAESNAMSEFVELEFDSTYPKTATPGNDTLYMVTAVRGGQGVLEVRLSAEDLPDGATATFTPSVLKFTGRSPETLIAYMTITTTDLTATDEYPIKVRGIAKRQDLSLDVSVRMNPQAPSLPSQLPTLFIERGAGGDIVLHGNGSGGVIYGIEATTDLANPDWTAIGTCTADGNGRFTYIDTETEALSTRFYRAVEPAASPLAPTSKK